MALSANRELNRFVDQELRAYEVALAEHVFKGSLVGVHRATGYARTLVAGDVFVGVAYEEADNSEGANGSISVRVYTQGDFILPVADASQALVGAPVFAADDESVTVLPSAGATPVGTLIDYLGADSGIVRILPGIGQVCEHAVAVPLASSTAAATTNPVLITQRAIKIVSIQVSFNTKPDQGALDVGTDNSDPDELVDAFDLASLNNNAPQALTLAGRDVAKNFRIWARVGQAGSTAGVGGLLTVRFVELP